MTATPHVRDETGLGYLAVLLVVFLWGVGPLFVRAVDASALTIATTRNWIAVPVALLIAWTAKAPLTRRSLLAAIPGGALFAIAQTLGFASFHETSLANAAIIGAVSPLVIVIVAVPLFGDGGVTGVLSVSRRPGDEPFDQLDLDLVTAVAAHAGLAMQLSQVRQDNEQLRLAEDREQIGEDLRHRVIHRLFGHGLALQGTASRATNPQTRTAIQTQINEVDTIIRDIRAAVFALTPPPPTRTPAEQVRDPDTLT